MADAKKQSMTATTRQIDRSVEPQKYWRHPSLRTIVHIDPGMMDVIDYRRTACCGWDDKRFERPQDGVLVPDAPVSLRLAGIYDGIPVASGADTVCLSRSATGALRAD